MIYKEEIRAKYKVMEIVKGMGGWAFPMQKPNRSYMAKDRHGNKMLFGFDYHYTKISIAGESVYSKHYTESIGVSFNRNPNAIRKEIIRRLMPKLREQYKRDKIFSNREKRMRNAIINEALHISSLMGKKLNRTLYSHLNRGSGLSINIKMPNNSLLTVDHDFNGGLEIDMHLKCNVVDARDIVTMVASRHRRLNG